MRRAIPLLVVLTACSPTVAEPGPTDPTVASTTTVSATTTSLVSTTTTVSSTTTPPDPHRRPDWLGTRPLPLREDGFGEVLPTPPELVDRSLATPALLAPPTSDSFSATVLPVPEEVVARSTWTPACPVGLDDLRYVTVTHWGFDGDHHTGELLVHADHAYAIVDVFSALHAARFPIEEMRVIRTDELDLPPTGDGNVTTGFVCRPVVGSSAWSMHASGEAVDINPFHNPYVKGDLVLPELASAYTDRNDVRPGMIVEGDVVVQAFDAIGWHWGGRWTSLTDPMHFSTNGR
ncbi:MAG: M15 family metallopeptidase [Acidimicrobiia bacterium]